MSDKVATRKTFHSTIQNESLIDEFVQRYTCLPRTKSAEWATAHT